ncbi:MAG: acetate uptake transporter [Candidatus Thermoplasmatota archaeon]
MTGEKNILANPAPLGLMGFGMTTVLLNIHNAGLFGLGSMIVAMGICYGGFAQVIAGILEYKKGNTFGVTAFTSYGLFWLSFAFLLILPELGVATKYSNTALAFYLFMWGLFTMFMFIGTLKLNTGLQVVFLTLFILFYLLALENWGIISGSWIGIEGIICGLSAIYVAMAEVINELYGKEIVPLGRPVI